MVNQAAEGGVAGAEDFCEDLLGIFRRRSIKTSCTWSSTSERLQESMVRCFIMLGNGDVFYKASKLGVGESGSNIQGGTLWWRFDFLFSAG